MLKSVLAEDLRQQQIARVKDLSDDDVIENFLYCPGCGNQVVNETELEFALRTASDTEHFVRICQEIHANDARRSMDARKKGRKAKASNVVKFHSRRRQQKEIL